MSRYTGARPLVESMEKVPFPDLKVQTKKLFDRGMMINGTHVEKMVPLELFLETFEDSRDIRCRSCRQPIKKGELAGRSAPWESDGIHCHNCIVIPDGLEKWLISYQGRRSKNRPDGVVARVFIHHAEVLREYVQALSNEYEKEIKVEKWSL